MPENAAFADALLATRPGTPERTAVLLDSVLAEESYAETLEDEVADVAFNVGELSEVVKDIEEFFKRPDVVKIVKSTVATPIGGRVDFAADLRRAFDDVEKAQEALNKRHEELLG